MIIFLEPASQKDFLKMVCVIPILTVKKKNPKMKSVTKWFFFSNFFFVNELTRLKLIN